MAKTTSALQNLNQTMRAEHGVRLGAVFIDTVGAAFGLQDENSAAEVNAAMRAMRKLSEELKAAVVPVHHYGKATTTGLRGSSAFRGAADVVLSVLCERDETTGDANCRSLCLAKAREGEEGPIAGFELEWILLGVDDDGEEIGSCAVKLLSTALLKKKVKVRQSAGAKVALQALAIAIDEVGVIPTAGNHIPAQTKCVTVMQWRDYSYRRGISGSDEARAKQVAFQRANEALIASRAVAAWDQWVWPTN